MICSGFGGERRRYAQQIGHLSVGHADVARVQSQAERTLRAALEQTVPTEVAGSCASK